MKLEAREAIERLFHEARELKGEDRDRFLSQECGGDLALRRTIEMLLEEDETAEKFLDTPMLDLISTTLAPGTMLGPYEVLGVAGIGAMGQVYRAHDRRLNRDVAIKALPVEFTLAGEPLARIRREATLLASVNHPNVATIYDVLERDLADSFLILEYVEGPTLAERLSKGPVPLHETLHIAHQIALALEAAHDKGIVHRDLKPANIKLTPNGIVKILDFGLAKVFTDGLTEADPSAAGLVRSFSNTTSSFRGTPAYMSPEQVVGTAVEHRTDIWAFGCVVFELLTGRRAFEGTTVPATSASILKAEPDWSLLPESTPLEMRHLLQQSLQKDAKRRPQSASELRWKIETHSSPVPGLVVFPGEPKLTQKTFRAVWVSVLSALLLVALASALWWSWQKPQQPVLRLISTFPEAIGPASFSPDGSTIAFPMRDGAGVPQIWTKNLAQGDPIQVTFDPRGAAGRPRWSPRNDQIIFSRARASTPGWQSIWSVPPLGGQLRLLIDRGHNPDGTSHPEGGRDPSFSWDGSRIVFTRASDIWTANADGSNQRKVEGVADAKTPTFSPDGSLIAYFRGTGPFGEVWVIPSKGGRPRQLTFDNEITGTPVWRPDGGHIVFSSQRRGSLTLWEIAINGGEPRPVLLSAGEDTNPEISRDGRKLIYSTTRNLFSLTVLDPATQLKRELREVRTEMRAPVFSPAGDRIAFGQMAEGGWHLFITEADGRNLTQVTKGEGEINHFPRWSRDGSALYFYKERPIPSFRKISLQGGQSVELVRGWTFESHWLAHVDPQDKLVAHSPIESGFVIIGTFIREIATGKETLFRKRMYEPQWSKDGLWILGAEVNSGTTGDAFGDIVVCLVSTGECRKIAIRANRPIWSHDGSRVYFHRFRPQNRGLFSVSIDGTDERLVAELGPLPPYNNFSDVSPKGEVAYVQFKPGKPELWMMDLK